MADDDEPEDRAHARRTNRKTSHDAAAGVTPRLPTQKKLVTHWAQKRGPGGFIDLQLEEAFPNLRPQSVRTRRSELVACNIILDSKTIRHAEGADHTVWVHRDHVENPPPIIKAACGAPARDVLKGEAMAQAAVLRLRAAGLRKTYGLDAIAREIEHGADLLARLGR